MKIYSKIILIITTVMVTSCSDSFLELTPQQGVADTEALTNIEDFNSSITGVYNEMSSSDYYGRYMIMIPDVMSDDVKQNSQANRIIFYAEHVVNVSDANASATWTDMYQAINAANQIINSNVEVPSGIQSQKDHIIGEAHALRGLIYFDLVRFFAQHYTFSSGGSHPGVPLILTFDPANKPARNTVNEVYDQVISDMTRAISLMDSDSRSGNSNTLSATSVMGLLSRVYLYKEDWSNAEAMASAVIGSSKYSLVGNDSYSDLWTKDNNSESIFEFSMTESDNVGANGSIGGLYLANGFGDYLPSNDVVSLYDPSDQRLSVFTEDDFLSGDYAPFRMEKYPSTSGFNNIKVMRLAELYLIRAEARAETGNDSGAQQDFNVVRQRALSSAPDNTDTGQALKDAIFLERRLELCFEGQRLWDLMRKKQDVVRSNCTSLTCLIPYGSNSVVLPIPQLETDVNSNIEQNPGY
ncbi:MAG: RagB/SusD family nutrient uptake outer membrane protein [Saprospiraceae bacterium]|nr:RagB/SusD family nutrient uptake outer membrane protein [Saprospiraceae bacterium]